MKKAIIIFLLCVFSVSAFGQSIVLFPGTGDHFIDTDGEEKDTDTVRLQVSLDAAYSQFKSVENPILIGHSQGGMRAMALATKRTNNDLLTEGVISVGGPLQGFIPLEGTYKKLSARINSVVDDIARGLTAAGAAINPVFGFLKPGEAAEKCVIGMITGDEDSEEPIDQLVRVIFTNSKPPEYVGFGNTKVSWELVTDFTPESDFIQTNLQPSRTRMISPAQTRRVFSHYETRWIRTYTLLPFNIKFWYWKTIKVPVYKYVRIPAKYEDLPLVNSNTRIAYLTGINTSLDDLFYDLDDPNDPDDNTFETFQTVKNHCQVTGDILNGVAIADRVWSTAAFLAACAHTATLNIPAAIAATLLSGQYAKWSIDADKASGMLLDLDTTYNVRVLNTELSDGFIPVSTTTLSYNNSGGRGWGTDLPKGEDFPLVHTALADDPSIWGGDANGKPAGVDLHDHSGVQRGGYIAETLFWDVYGKERIDPLLQSTNQTEF